MQKKIFSLFLFSCVVLFSFAQKKTASCHFHSINSLALVNGNNPVSAAVQSVNGFQKGNWFAGIGAGIDYYLYRTVPLFTDVRYAFGKKKNNFFAYADGGINISWVEKYEPGQIIIWDGSASDSKYFNGVFTDAGLGYLVKMKNENALVIALGHSHKTLKETNTYTDWRTRQPQTDINRFKLNRIVIKAGWRF